MSKPIIVEVDENLYYTVKNLPDNVKLEIRDYDIDGIPDENLLTDEDGRKYVDRTP